MAQLQIWVTTVYLSTADAQKAAKQAIYSLHRSDFQKAEQQIASVGACVFLQHTMLVQAAVPISGPELSKFACSLQNS